MRLVSRVGDNAGKNLGAAGDKGIKTFSRASVVSMLYEKSQLSITYSMCSKPNGNVWL